MSESYEPMAFGTVLDGKWKIERPLGEGGMGVVYAAAHARNGLAVAIKVLHPKVAKDKGVKERFLYEGYAANRVGHAGTVQVLDDGQTSDGLVYLVMERLVGEVVADRAHRLGGALPLPEVLAIADASLDILAAAHRAGIVHRDFKPENLFLTREGILKVLDFGLARVKETTNKARLTVAGVLMGTPAFMPPEQAQANWDEVDARSDVYSIGASLFSLATGGLVHEGATPLQILVKVSTEPAPPFLSQVPHAPPAVAAVVDRALAKPRDQRWPDAGAMLDALRNAVRSTSFPTASLRAMASSAPLEAPKEVAPDRPRATEASAPIPFDARPAPSPNVKSPQVGTVAPISSEPPTTRKRPVKKGGSLGLVISGGLLAAVAVAFVVALMAFRNIYRKSDAPNPGASALPSANVKMLPK